MTWAERHIRILSTVEHWCFVDGCSGNPPREPMSPAEVAAYNNRPSWCRPIDLPIHKPHPLGWRPASDRIYPAGFWTDRARRYR